MLEKIIEWSIRNTFVVVLATVFLVVGGIYSLRNIPIDAIPDLSDVQVIIFTDYPGQAPQVVEDQVNQEDREVVVHKDQHQALGFQVEQEIHLL